MLPYELDRSVPPCSVQQRSFEIMEPFDVGPLPGVRNTGGIDKNVAAVAFDRSIFEAVHLNIPLPSLAFPRSPNDLMPQFDIFP